MLNKEVSPRELTYEIEKRAYQQTTLVMLTLSQWRTIEQAYNSPLVDTIERTILKITPIRTVETKKLTFRVFARE